MMLRVPDEVPSFQRTLEKYGDKYANSISTNQFSTFCTEYKCDDWITREETDEFLNHIGMLASAG